MLFSLLSKQHGRKKLLKKADKILRNKQNKLLTRLWGTRRSVWQSMRKNKNTPRRIFLDYNQWTETEARLRKSHSLLFKNFYQQKKGKEGVRKNVSRVTILTSHTSLTRWGKNESKGELEAVESVHQIGKRALPGKNTASNVSSDLRVPLEHNFRLKEQTGYRCPRLRLLPSPGLQTLVWMLTTRKKLMKSILP